MCIKSLAFSVVVFFFFAVFSEVCFNTSLECWLSCAFTQTAPLILLHLQFKIKENSRWLLGKDHKSPLLEDCYEIMIWDLKLKERFVSLAKSNETLTPCILILQKSGIFLAKVYWTLQECISFVFPFIHCLDVEVQWC